MPPAQPIPHTVACMLVDSSLSASASIDLLCQESKWLCIYKYFYGT